MLLKLGFARSWDDLVMKFITLVTYSVQINNNRSQAFSPTGGLRQGDLIAPYLFLIVVEWLSKALDGLVNRDRLTGVRICRDAPLVTHLIFC